jgi:aconitase B
MNADKRRSNKMIHANRRSSAFIGGCKVLARTGHYKLLAVMFAEEIMIRQKNLWVSSGSGSLPSE